MNLIKSLAVVATVAVTIASSALLADAARTTKKNNTGNKCKYSGSIDISLGWHGMNNGALGTIYSEHYVYYSKPQVTLSPYNNAYEKNKAVYYAEWKKSGKIKDKITKTYTVKNNKYKYRDLSDDMKWNTWDSDITYFRYDVYPYSGDSTISKTLKSEYSRRASTSITH